MGVVIDMESRRAMREPAPLIACTNCGEQWFITKVLIDTDHNVMSVGAIVECTECGQQYDLQETRP